ncbi:cation:proton antiporter [Heyndrickxia acidiproducens]|uniref:cation:proton antiporter n=1 Tax=Heyndrickxia acidiproducens TaxID=1121084 RepID=UPI00036C6ECD|nr:cation:proton antiporter [Heyndrickxia acidiproducens]
MESLHVHEFNNMMIQLVILLIVSVGVASIAYFRKKPYSIPLVFIGLVLGWFQVPFFEATKDFITNSEVFQIFVISIFLPALLGEAALKLPFSQLRENKTPILALAIGGTLITFLFVGLSSFYLLGLPVAVAFTFAALMSPTDPISVLQIFKPLHLNKKISAIIEGESLFNDGIGVVLFQISSVYLVSYIEMGALGFGNGLLLFLKFAVGGCIVGLLIGYLGSISIKDIDSYPLEITISVIVFFGSYLLGETLHVSGVIAVVLAGLVLGNYGGKIGMSSVTKLNIYNFWDVIAFMANAVIFLIVGLELATIQTDGKWAMIIAGILFVLLGRSIAVYGSLVWMKRIPLSWKHLFNYGGLKGSLSVALALSLPRTFTGREDIIVLTFSAVLFSLLFQGLTIKTLVKKLGIIENASHIGEYEELAANITISQNAIQTWTDLKKHSLIHDIDYLDLVRIEEENLKKYNQLLQKLYVLHPEIKQEQLKDAQRAALYNQYHELVKLHDKEIISEDTLEKYQKEILEKIEELL